jgi:1-acyl-sn-glycerol-3-phosphate acyltransferase
MNFNNKKLHNKNHDGWFINFTYILIRKTLGPLIRLIWVKNVVGLDNIPKKGPAIIAFNHSSYFDFFCFMAVSPRNIHYLAAEKFFNSLLWKPLMKFTGQIEVKRAVKDKRCVHDKVYCHLNSNKLIGIFPEGTRSPDGNLLRAFRGVAFYATKLNVPVVPVGLTGTHDVMARQDKFPKFKKIIGITVGKPISFDEYRNVKLNKKAHQILSDRIMLNIADLIGKKYAYSCIKNNHKKI